MITHCDKAQGKALECTERWPLVFHHSHTRCTLPTKECKIPIPIWCDLLSLGIVVRATRLAGSSDDVRSKTTKCMKFLFVLVSCAEVAVGTQVRKCNRQLCAVSSKRLFFRQQVFTINALCLPCYGLLPLKCYMCAVWACFFRAKKNNLAVVYCAPLLQTDWNDFKNFSTDSFSFLKNIHT